MSDPKFVDMGKTWDQMVDEFEQRLLLNFIEHYRGNVRETARAIRLTRPRLYRLVRKHRLVGRLRMTRKERMLLCGDA